MLRLVMASVIALLMLDFAAVRAGEPMLIPAEPNAVGAPDGHPLTSVVVTQCNLIVAVYVTMPDGRLLRFDKSAEVPADQLLAMAYTAIRSERVEVSCNGSGPIGYERHGTTT